MTSKTSTTTGLLFTGLSLLCMIFAVTTARSQNEYVESASWHISLANELLNPIDIREASDTSVIVLATWMNKFPSGPDSRAIIACYSLQGEELWKTEIDERPWLTPRALVKNGEGWKVIGVCRRETPASYPNYLWVAELGQDGELQTFVETDSLGIQEARNVVDLGNGGYAVMTRVDRVDRYDSDNRQLWSTDIELQHATSYQGIDLTDDGIVITVRQKPSDTTLKAFNKLFRISDKGKLLWSTEIEASHHDHCIGVRTLRDGSFVVFGFQREYAGFSPSMLSVVRVDSKGVQKEQIVDATYDQIVADLIEREDGELLAVSESEQRSRFSRIYFGEVSGVEYPEMPESRGPIKLLETDPNRLVLLARHVWNDQNIPFHNIHTAVMVMEQEGLSSVAHEILKEGDLNLY